MKSYGQIAYERYQYWRLGKILPAWEDMGLAERDDWEEVASKVIDAWETHRHE